MKSLALFLFALLCSGCLHIKHIDEGNQSMDAVNQIARHHVLYVHHFGDRRAAAERLKITPTHTSWLDTTTGSYVTIPTREIVDIKIQEQVARKSGGFGMGMLAGASMGVMFGLSGDTTASDKSTIAVLGGMGMGLLGGMVGQMTSSRSSMKLRVVWTNPDVPIRRAVW